MRSFGANADYNVHFVKRYTLGAICYHAIYPLDAIYFANAKCDYNSQRSSDNYALSITNYNCRPQVP